MPMIQVTIAGRSYRMACGEGEEAHLEGVAAAFEAKIAELRGSFGEIGDTRLTVMAALTIADELAEAGRKQRHLEEEITALQDARVAAGDRAQATQAAIVAALNSAAERIESIARTLNQTVGNGSGVALG